MTPEKIAQKFVGVPFKSQGRDMAGMDCYGLVMAIYKDAGVILYDTNDEYDAKKSVKERDYFLKNYWREWDEVKTPEFLDVVAVENFEGAVVHIGVYLGDGKFIHTCKAGTVVTHTSIWKDRIYGYYRYKWSK